MSADDDLGSFFEEINQIEAAVAPSTATNISITTVPPAIVVQERPVSYAPKVISKAPEIVYKSSHPVYTYDQPGLAEIDVSAEDTSNNNRFQIAPTLSSNFPVPPPQVPRSSKVFVRHAADETWVDESLQEWPENDYRIFVGDLAKEVTTENLAKMFQQYKSFAKAKVIRTKFESKARGFGFVSFLDPMDCAKAIREQNGKYLLTRPMKITKSSWKDRDLKEVQKKDKKKRKIQESLGLV